MSRPAADPVSLLAAVLLGALFAAPGAASARSTDRNQPLDVQSATSTCSLADDGPCSFHGDVHLVQGTLVVDAAHADVQRANGDIRRVILTGAPVTLTQQMDNGSMLKARAARVDYDMATDTVVFTGSALIDQPGRGNIAGERIAYNMQSGQVQSGGDNGGRVHMTILPKGARTTPPKQDKR